MRLSTLVPLGLLVILAALPAGAQYLYLDANGDGIHDSNDRLDLANPTTIDVWYVTDRNRDGSPVVCDVDAGFGLTINSYTFVLHAVGGDVRWGPMLNRLSFVHTPVPVGEYSDTTNASYYHNGWAGRDIFPPGKYMVATLTVEVTSGDPSLFVEPFLPSRPTKITQFGTKCPARDDDNTYKLGYDWNDADGIGAMRAEAGGPYRVRAGVALHLSGTESRTTSGHPFAYSWDFGDGQTASGASLTHVYAAIGDYTLILTARSGDEIDTDTTTVHVVEEDAPIAVLRTQGSGYVGVLIWLDGRGSYDPDGDPLVHRWTFGDGGTDQGQLVYHGYGRAGVFTVRLTVDDGIRTDTASEEVTIRATAHSPTANAGGPYAGIVGRVLQVNGSTSSDPDGDPLQYAWEFGDGGAGYDVVTSHSYSAPGAYTVRLTVSDGYSTDTALTSAAISEFVPARAFGNEAIPAVTLGAGDPLVLHVEPFHGSFRLDDVVLWPVTLRSTGTGSVEEIGSASDAVITEDVDQNGEPELTLEFGSEELSRLLANVEESATVTVRMSGSLYSGGAFAGDFQLLVRRPDAPSPGDGSAPLRISPNPFNPEAIVTFSNSRQGRFSAQLYDVRGRSVRTVLQDQTLAAGPHVFPLSARGDDGTVLASGIYFFRLVGPDGVTTKRVAVAK